MRRATRRLRIAREHPGFCARRTIAFVAAVHHCDRRARFGAGLVRIRLFERGDRLAPGPLFRELLAFRDEILRVVVARLRQPTCGQTSRRETNQLINNAVRGWNVGLRPSV